MGNPLAINISHPSAPHDIVIYWHWGSETDELVTAFRKEIKDVLRPLKNCKDLATVLKAILSKQCDGAGLSRSITWYEEDWWNCDPDNPSKEAKEKFEAERAIYDSLVEQGIPVGTNRNSGLIGVSPKLNDALMFRADWVEWIDTEDL